MDFPTTKCITLKGIQSKKVEADFSGGTITSDAEVLLLREASRRTGLIRALSRAVEV